MKGRKIGYCESDVSSTMVLYEFHRRREIEIKITRLQYKLVNCANEEERKSYLRQIWRLRSKL